MAGQGDDQLDQLGRLLREYRRAAGLTQRAVAELAGLSERGLQAIETGERRPYPRTLARLVSALRLAPAQEAQVAAAARRSARKGRPNRHAAGPGGAPGEQKPATALCAGLADLPLFRARLAPSALRAAVAAWLEIARREVERYGGAIEQIDDGRLVALFGVPTARQDHAVAALRAALAIRDAPAGNRDRVRRSAHLPFRSRIGLDSGLVEVYQEDASWRVARAGDSSPPESAARLERRARPDGIWAGEATRRAAGDAFAWRSLPPVPSVAGRTSELLGTRADHAMPSTSQLPIVGRLAERERLRAAWADARSGRGRVVSVAGEAGSGKSRLLHELTRLLDAEDVPWAVGACFEHAAATAYLPFRAIVRGCLGQVPGARDLDEGLGDVERLAALGLDAACAPYLRLLLGARADDPLLRRLPPDVLRARTVDAVVRLLLAAADRRPRAIVVEDVHWIDGGSEAIVATLAESLRDHALLLVLTGRPEELHPWGAPSEPGRPAGAGPSASIAATLRAILRQPQSTRIDLGRLAPVETRRLVEQVADRPLPAELVRLAADRAAGNPLFAVALARDLTDRPPSTRRRRPPTASAPPPADGLPELPATVRDVLLARADRLPPSLKRVLQTAAVVGPEFGYPVLAATAEPGLELESALVRLEDLGFVSLVGLAPERRYAFGHALMQVAIYETLLPATARSRHERVGRAIETLYADSLEEHLELLAYHYARGGDDEKAVEYLALASRKAARSSAVAEAYACFEAALQRLDKLPDSVTTRARRVGLLVEQFPVVLLLGRLPEYRALLGSVAPLVAGLGRTDLLAAYLGVVGACEWAVGEIEQARATLLRALDAAGSDDDQIGAMAEVMLGRCELDLGHYEAALRAFDRALPVVERSLDLHWHRLARTGAMWVHAYRGRWEAARAVAAEARRVGEALGDDGTLAEVALNLALIATDEGDLDRAASEARRAVALAPTPTDRLLAQGVLGIVECHLGSAERGVALIEQAVPALSSGGLVPAAIVGGVALGGAYARAALPELARATLAEYARRAAQAGMRFQRARAERLLGEMALEARDDSASGHLERSIALLADLDAAHELALARAAYDRLCAAGMATATPTSTATS